MKILSVLSISLCVGLSTTAGFAQGVGMGPHGSVASRSAMSTRPVTGGAFGTSPNAPGTNSLGTALSSDAVANGPQKGPLLGTSPAVDREEARVHKMMASICRGC